MTSPYINALCHSIVQSGLVLLLQSSIILMLGLLLGALLHRHGPQAQLLAYRAALTTVALTGIASLLFSSHVQPIWRITLPTGAAAISALTSTSPQADTPISLPTTLPHSGPLPPMPANGAKTAPPTRVLILTSPSPPESGNHWYVAAALIWAIGAICLFAWLALGQMHLLLLGRKARPISVGTAADMLHKLHPEGALTLLVSPQVCSPFLTGIWHPTIYLPASYEQDFTEDELRMVLAHEVAHWQNRDNAWLLFTRVICATLWIQPLLWILASRLEQSSEEACDMAVLDTTCSPANYAACLLALAEHFTPSRLERAAGAGIAPFRSQIGNRITKILQNKERPMSPISNRMKASSAICAGATALCGTIFVSAGAAPHKAIPAVKRAIIAKHGNPVWNIEKKSLLRGRYIYQHQLQDEQHQLASAQRNLKLHPAPTSQGLVALIRHGKSMQTAAANVHAVKQHDLELAGHLNAIANVDKLTQKVAATKRMLSSMDGMIRRIESKTLSQEQQANAPAKATNTDAMISSVLNKQGKTLLHQRNVTQSDLNSAQHQLASAQHDLKLHPAPSSIPRIYANSNALSMQAKKDYIHKVHQHNNELVAYWDAIWKVHKWTSKVATLQTTLDVLNMNKQSRYLEWKTLTEKMQGSK